MGFFSLPPKGVWSTYQKLGDIVDIDVVMWGNAMGDPKNATCQHGPVECRAMLVYGCSKYTADTKTHLSFIECFDSTLIKTFPKGLPPGTVNVSFADATLKACASAQGRDYAKLDTCAKGAEGAGYFAQEKAKTKPHSGVPALSINDGSVMYNSQTLDLIAEVCKAYTGGDKPAACSEDVAKRLDLSGVPSEEHTYHAMISPA